MGVLYFISFNALACMLLETILAEYFVICTKEVLEDAICLMDSSSENWRMLFV